MNGILNPMQTATSQTAQMRDGAQLAYRLVKGSGPARFALVHSLALNGDFWNRVVPHLQEAGDVLVYDCRSHGASTKSSGPYTGALFADDLADLLKATGWESAIVAGASMGGCVTLAFAANYPEKVQGIGLIDTTAWYGLDAPAQWEDRAQKAISGGLDVLVNFQKTRWFSDKFNQQHPEIVNAAVDVFLANDIGVYAETCRMLGHFDERAALPSIKVPAAVLVGEEDYAAPIAMAEFIHKEIAGSTLNVIKGVRHLTPLECPEIVADAIRALVSR